MKPRWAPAANRFAAAGAALFLFGFAGPLPAAPIGGTMTGGPQAAVPYVAQTRQLCGGAAVAMVFRYWGARGVDPKEFQSLVDRKARGIPTDRLVSAVGERGWKTRVFHTNLEDLRLKTRAALPIVALIEVGRSRYHYVVVTEIDSDSAGEAAVVFHDPAVRPSRRMRAPEFERRWAAADHWALLITPEPVANPATLPVVPASAAAGATSPEAAQPGVFETTLDEAVDLARSGRLAEASARLEAARKEWPDSSRVYRELAGVRYLQENWKEAARLAGRATAMAPEDTLAWYLLASSRYATDDKDGALQAWNRIGEPRLDDEDLGGLARTRYPVLAGAATLTPGRKLSVAALRQARRRVGELPTVTRSWVDYRPSGDGYADLEMHVVERPLLPASPAEEVALALRALATEEVSVSMASPTGGGEQLDLAWRWPARRPRIGAALLVPGVLGFTGITTVAGFREKETYATGDTDEWRHAGLRISDWTAGDLGWNLGVAWDRFSSTGSRLALSAGGDYRPFGDSFSLTAGTSWWGSGRSITALNAGASLDLEDGKRRRSFDARVRWDRASRDAPAILWPGAGTGQGRTGLLRAHPLLHEDILAGDAFGRELVNATIEAGWHPWRLGFLPAGFAVFVDAAAVNFPGDPGTQTPRQVDAGLGLRLGLAGAGTLRLDAAHGLRDGVNAVSLSIAAGPRKLRDQ